MRVRRLASLALLCAASAAAQEGAFLSEPADCAAGVRIEAGATWIASEPNFLTGAPRARWDAPVARAATCLDGRAEFELEWTGRVGASGDPEFGNVSDFGDLVVRAKLRLAGGAVEKPTLAVRFVTALPQTSFGNGLGSNTVRFSAQLLGTLPLGRGRFHANAGVALLEEVLRPHEQRDLFAYGVQLAVPLGAGDRAPVLVVETAGQLGDGQPGADARAEARAGIRVHRGRVTWSAALRRGLLEADGTWGAAAFVVMRLGAKGDASRDPVTDGGSGRAGRSAAALVP